MTPTISPDPSNLREIPIKRFYLPFTLAAPCEGCGKPATCNLDTDGGYLSYPSTVSPNIAWVYCAPCRRETRVGVRITFTIEGCEAPPEPPDDDPVAPCYVVDKRKGRNAYGWHAGYADYDEAMQAFHALPLGRNEAKRLRRIDPDGTSEILFRVLP